MYSTKNIEKILIANMINQSNKKPIEAEALNEETQSQFRFIESADELKEIMTSQQYSQALEAYKNLIRADECSLQEVAGRAERQHFQKEAIAECRVLAGLLECFFGEDVKDSLCKRAAEVRRMTAAWLHGEQRQVIQKGAVK